MVVVVVVVATMVVAEVKPVNRWRLGKGVGSCPEECPACPDQMRGGPKGAGCVRTRTQSEVPTCT